MTQGWQKVRLGDVLSIKHGFAFSGSRFSDDPSYPALVTPGNFAIGGGFRLSKPKTFTGEVPRGYELSAGDLLITMTDLSKEVDTLGLPALVPEGSRHLHNQRIGLVEVSDTSRVNKEFLSYFLRTAAYRNYIVGTASGSTVRHTSPSRVEDYRAVLPPVIEQQSVAEVLSALDDKIAANAKLANTSGELAAVRLSGMRPSIALGDAVVHCKESVNPSLLSEPEVAHYSLPAFDAAHQPDRVAPVSIKSNKYQIRRPSVLVSKLNPRFPRVWNVRELPAVPALASTEFLVLEPKLTSASVLWSILSQVSFGRTLQNKVAGTSSSHQRVTPADLLATPIIDPADVLTEMAHTIDSLTASQSAVRAEMLTLADLRDALLPQLMSGKLRVKDAEQAVEEAV